METNIPMNLVLDTDSYKLSHFRQYPSGTTRMFSYLESRGGKFSHTLFFGLQYYLKKYLTHKITVAEVDEAAQFAKAHGVPFNYDDWTYIATELKGRIPIKIRAVPEGTLVPAHNILMSVESTDPKCFWAVSWFETMLVRLWYPITAATQSYFIKQDILQFLEQTADDPAAEISFKLHDFGSRGVSSQESAMIGGAAHLVNFRGSDTVAGIYMANKFYTDPMAAFSIPASEHSTITAWGKENEAKAYRNMLEVYKDQPIFACVSDSYDIYHAAGKIWGEELKADVLNYKGTLVIRPDSGNPPEVVGRLLEILDSKFGSTINSKGYKVLNKVRVIQGDGVNQESIKEILTVAAGKGFSATNLAFGMGGALLQKMDRDTQRFAFKCSWALVGGKEVQVFKSPVTDPGKKSKKGRLDLNKTEQGEVHTAAYPAQNSLMVNVYENGEILKGYTFDEVRTNANKGLLKEYRGWVDKPVDL